MTNNAYLDLYHGALAHQRRHRSLLPTISGEREQPMEWCTNCRANSSHPEVPRAGLHHVKQRYSWAVPNEEAIRTIAYHSPRGVVEIGAGGGYWAKMLREHGVDVIAYDPDPEGTGEHPWHSGRQWSEVLKGDHTSVIGHPDRTLLLCWPMYSADWSDQAVELYGGNTVIYIGEGNGGCTGSDRMHALLGGKPYCPHYDEPCTCEWPAAQFHEVATVEIPQWWGLHDRLYVYSRNERADE